jgi:hypothetical protein
MNGWTSGEVQFLQIMGEVFQKDGLLVDFGLILDSESGQENFWYFVDDRGNAVEVGENNIIFWQSVPPRGNFVEYDTKSVAVVEINDHEIPWDYLVQKCVLMSSRGARK